MLVYLDDSAAAEFPVFAAVMLFCVGFTFRIGDAYFFDGEVSPHHFMLVKDIDGIFVCHYQDAIDFV